MGPPDSTCAIRYDGTNRRVYAEWSIDVVLGASSAVPREDQTAFSSQIEGMCISSNIPAPYVTRAMRLYAALSETVRASIRRGRPGEGQLLALRRHGIWRIKGTPRVHGLTHCTEVDRAIDNLVKSGKMFNMPARRDSTPMAGTSRGYQEYGEQHHPRSRLLPTSNAAARPQNGRYASTASRLR